MRRLRSAVVVPAISKAPASIARGKAFAPVVGSVEVVLVDVGFAVLLAGTTFWSHWATSTASVFGTSEAVSAT